MKLTHKVAVCLTAALLLTALGLSSYASVMIEGTNGNVRWYGMGVESVLINTYSVQGNNVSIAHGFTPVPNRTAEETYFSEGYETVYTYDTAPNDISSMEMLEAVYYRNNSLWFNEYAFGFQNPLNMADLNFQFDSFMVTTKQSQGNWLTLTNYTGTFQHNRMIYVDYDYDYYMRVEHTDGANGVGYVDVSFDHVNEQQGFDFSKINYIEFMPPTVQQYIAEGKFINANVYILVTNLKVSVYDFPATTSNSSAKSMYKFSSTTGSPITMDYTDGGFDVIQEYNSLGFYDDEYHGGMLDWLVSSVDSFLSIQVAPGLSLGGIFGLLVGFGLLMAILKMFAGG